MKQSASMISLAAFFLVAVACPSLFPAEIELSLQRRDAADGTPIVTKVPIEA
jgi:hypothetical protein